MTRLVTIVVTSVALLGISACEPADVNRWMVDHGKPPLTEPALSKVAAAMTAWEQEQARRASFVGTVSGVTQARLGRSWRPGCPVGPADLRLLTLSYWGTDGVGHVGELIVHRSIALATVAVFRELWDAKFPIHQMATAEKFVDASDFRPDGTYIETNEPDFENNTSAFFCRPTTGGSSWSEHTFGRAIDVNPLMNPYVKDGVVVPPNGVHWPQIPGTITRGSIVVDAMRRAGLSWGGNWTSLKDYMHFSTSGR